MLSDSPIRCCPCFVAMDSSSARAAGKGTPGHVTQGTLGNSGDGTQVYATPGTPSTPWASSVSAAVVLPPNTPMQMRIPGTQIIVHREAYEFMLNDYELLKERTLANARESCKYNDPEVMAQVIQAKMDVLKNEW